MVHRVQDTGPIKEYKMDLKIDPNNWTECTWILMFNVEQYNFFIFKQLSWKIV